MAAIVTDQFRINNASNFLGDVNDSSNSYYVFVGLSNPATTGSGVPANGFGRATTESSWNSDTPNPTDDFNYLNHTKDTILFGKKITSDNIRRVIRKVTWTSGQKYEIYRNDYSSSNMSPVTDSARLYDANYFVINKDYNVYICIDNGSSGISTEGNRSQNEPLFTGLEPSRAAGDTDDGYRWKFLFSVAPSDIIKFDATEFIPLPNNWLNSTDAQISAVRDNGNSDVNNNQIKRVYIEDQGNGYSGTLNEEFDIIGDGSGGKVVCDIVNTKITNTEISVGGKGYTYGMVNLDRVSNGASTRAKLIPIIPPSKGHGYDLYKELGADRILVYARFDDSTKDFPIDTKFSQIGIVKNPTSIGSTQVFTDNQFSSLGSLYLSSFPANGTGINVGDRIKQDIYDGTTKVGEAKGYVANFEIISDDIAVLKYYQDRSLYFNSSLGDQTDENLITLKADSNGTIWNFQSTTRLIQYEAGGGTTYDLKINTGFSGITTNPSGNKIIELGVEFVDGIASSEINNESGEIIYLDNRALITRDARQKEDIKVILEF